MSKFVVPSALVDPDRAEQTTATLCWSMYSLYQNKRRFVMPPVPLSRMKTNYERHYVLRYSDSKFSDACASVLLYKPLGRWIYGILVHIWGRARRWCPRRRGRARGGVRHFYTKAIPGRRAENASLLFVISYSARRSDEHKSRCWLSISSFKKRIRNESGLVHAIYTPCGTAIS